MYRPRATTSAINPAIYIPNARYTGIRTSLSPTALPSYVFAMYASSLPSPPLSDWHTANTDAGLGLDAVAPGSNVSTSIAPSSAPPAAQPPASVASAASYDSDSSDDIDIIMDHIHGAPAVAAPQPVAAYAALVPANMPPLPGMVGGGPAGIFGPVVVTDPAVNQVGQGYVVTPDHDLHLPTYFWPPGPKYYAVTRGRYVGVFNSSALFTMAICGVSSPVSRATRDLQDALDFFNAARRANMLEITG
ncbi:uncharacterized protein SCHCODRAFT_02662322 [Schizophyllum commune H4-8]|uniref:Uncharacterized protein n=1 Tax=Schizophyllum commune (strain H4-8 / FGSC 9210) TaxID=578458 RepID=D8PM77_SCHCM|nr:uncharacterized protein SCHCODRAFT_02662322 [Schizophyllum commune H4-8]KAI5897296.1 hypothetical protein SCHCODRAFT_02662322 [Schizophyllum commune H4-8]